MLFGLTNVPVTFQCMMNRVFEPFIRKSVIVFLDDILVYIVDRSAHLEHLRQVLLT
jgi:hypothetical protein